jgi:hypothetical protein
MMDMGMLIYAPQFTKIDGEPRNASETMASAFSEPVDGEDQTAIGRLEKLCDRSHQPSYNVDPLCRLINSRPAKSYKSEKRSFIRQSTLPV